MTRLPLSHVDPRLRGPLRRLPALPFDRSWARWVLRHAAGLAPSAPTPGVSTSTVHAGGPGAPAGRLHVPAVRRGPGALLWVHGGGMVIGGPSQDDRLCAATASALGIVVLAVGYRLAPEHPFPAPLDDCRASWTWLAEHAGGLDVDPARIAVGGQSAGGGLAACLAQRLHDEGGTAPVAQWLFCPMLDDRTAARRDLDAVGHRVWDNRANRYGWGAYLGQDAGAASLPPYAAAARRADLDGLPPAWFGVGDLDLFAEENRVYAERLRGAGTPASLRVVPGAPHGFEAWASGTVPAQEHVGAAQRWLAEALGAASV